jgi:hypothetical protein
VSWDNLAKALYDEMAEDIGTDQWGMSVHDREWWNGLAEAVRQFAGTWDPEDNEPVGLLVSAMYRFVDVPVVNGIAVLPDGRTVASTSDMVRIPVLVEPGEPDAEELDPSAEWNMAGMS